MKEVRKAFEATVWQSGLWESPEDGIVAISHDRLRAMLNEYGKGKQTWYRLADCEALAFGISLDAGCYPFIWVVLEVVNDEGPTGAIFLANVWLNPKRSLIIDVTGLTTKPER